MHRKELIFETVIMQSEQKTNPKVTMVLINCYALLLFNLGKF